MTLKLNDISTRAPQGADKEEIKTATKDLRKELGELQNLLYAEGKHSLLVILQGMDASGKDGTIRTVFSEVNPQGIRVVPFKRPTEEELSHDFLWRIHQNTPPKGMIYVFNRSHYEDVLVTRVEDMIDDETAFKRFEAINAFEQLLQDSGTLILKFYLHISEEEQQERFMERLEEREKNWKFNIHDLHTAKKWPEYRLAYQDAIDKCSDPVPWYLVPADQKWYKEFIVAQTIVERLKKLNMQYPAYEAFDE